MMDRVIVMSCCVNKLERDYFRRCQNKDGRPSFSYSVVGSFMGYKLFQIYI